MGCCHSGGAAHGTSHGLLRPPDQPGVVTTEWVTQSLAGARHPAGALASTTPSTGDVTVRGVSIEQMGAQGVDGRPRTDGGGNSGSRLVRVRLHDVHGGGMDGVASLVVKWAAWKSVPGLPFPMRIAHVVLFGLRPADLFRTEHYFFTHVAAALAHSGLRVPRVYVSALRDGAEPAACCRLAFDCRSDLVHTLLMQDCAGYRNFPPFSGIAEDHAAAALRNVARLHRATWGAAPRWAPDLDAIFGGGGLAKGPVAMFGLRGTGVAQKKLGFARSGAARKTVRLWGGCEDAGDKRGDSVTVLSRVSLAAADPGFVPAFEWLQQQWADLQPELGSTEAQCMVHGDFHHWNNMFGAGGEDDIYLVDWQYFGAGRVSYEVMHFLASSIDAGDPALDDRLMRCYHAALTETVDGKSIDYPYHVFERDCRLALVDAAVTLCLSYGTRTLGVQYSPKLYRNAIADDKQREYALGGMVLAERFWRRLITLHGTSPGCFAREGRVGKAAEGAEGERTPLIVPERPSA